jgi:hypothetical protein
MSILEDTRSIVKAEAEALAAVLAMYYRPLFGKVPGIIFARKFSVCLCREYRNIRLLR